jgi:competence CoiA-like predicted nuclease
MPKMTECLIGVDLANGLGRGMNQLRLKKGTVMFFCPECRKRVVPHEAAGRQAAHFEHLERSDCSLSDKR